MRILYIAYSCDPFNGSEDQIGWNIPLASLYSGNEVYVITKTEHKNNIEKLALKDNNINNIRFYYVDVPNTFKRIFRGIAYSMRIIIWQRNAFDIAKKICIKEKIDIIHQIAPIEFRAYGDYGRINSCKFVAGPVGGGYPVPYPLNWYVKAHPFQEGLRRILNKASFRSLKKSGRISRTEYIWLTNYETLNAFQDNHIILDKDKLAFQCDIGIEKNKIEEPTLHVGRKQIVFFVPGRLVYRKGHRLLFDAIEKTFNSGDDVVFRVAGVGPEENNLREIVKRSPILSNLVEFLGQIPFKQMKDEYRNCDVVILPSLTEATGTVVIEALSFGKPVITGEYFGAKLLLDNSAGWLYKGNTVGELINDFSNCLHEAYHDRNLIISKGLKALDVAYSYTWEEKVNAYNMVYNSLLQDKDMSGEIK